MKNSQGVVDPLISWLIVLLLPLYSLPWVMYRMYKLEKLAYVQFAFFMGLVGILYPPSGDLYRYYLDYTTYQNLDWNSFLLYALLEFDYLLSFLLYGLGYLRIPCDISRFIFGFVGYYLIGKLFLQLVRDNPSIRQYKGWCLLVFIVFSLNAYLYRSGLACVLFAYGAYYIIYKNSKKHWVFVLLSILTHFSFIVFAILLFFSKVMSLRFHRPLTYFVILVFFIFGIFNVGVFFDVLGSGGLSGALFERYKGSVEVDDAGALARGFSWKNLLWQRFGYFIALVLLFFFVKFRNESGKREWSFIDYLLLITVAVSPFSFVFGRFVAPLTFILKFFFFKHFNSQEIKKKFLRVLFYMVLVLDIMNVWAKRHEVDISDMSEITTSTSIGIIKHTYSDAWINRNITSYGDLEKYSN